MRASWRIKCHFGDVTIFCHMDGTKHYLNHDEEDGNEDDGVQLPCFATAEDYPVGYNCSRYPKLV